MERIKAPLCHRCAGILHGTVLDLYRIGGISEKETPCPWCQKERTDAIYLIKSREAKTE